MLMNEMATFGWFFCFWVNDSNGSLAATQPSFKRTLKNVGLPDKIDIRLSSRLQMPVKFHLIPPNTKILGAYATPKANTLKALFVLLI
jgi:hypothetical protein